MISFEIDANTRTGLGKHNIYSAMHAARSTIGSRIRIA